MSDNYFHFEDGMIRQQILAAIKGKIPDDFAVVNSYGQVNKVWAAGRKVGSRSNG